jgi:membrane dipeptidase
VRIPILASGAVTLALNSAGAYAPVVSETAPSADLLTLDTHMDTPLNFDRPGWDIMDRHRVEDHSQVDYPRMIDGKLKGGFFAIYVPQGPRTLEGNLAARDAALQRVTQIREMVAKHPDHFELALSADDANAIVSRGKLVVFISIENSYPLEQDLSLMSAFWALGVRMIGPVHAKNNDFADSATDEAEWHGLSTLGKRFVAEANRLGLVLDASHASDQVLDQMILLSKTPVILSHSGCKAVFIHPRNIDDARLKSLAASGGVIQINSLGASLSPLPENTARKSAIKALMNEAAASPMTPSRQQALSAQYLAIDAKYPAAQATFGDFMRHLLHALRVVGVDHVGIGADMDGGGGVSGMEDVAAYPRITDALLQAGYSRADLQKIWGGNILRVLRQVELYRDSAVSRP